MPRRKKTFACGHKGYGQSCHLCHQLQAVAAATLQATLVKQVRSLQALRHQEEEAPTPDPQERLIAAIEELTATLHRQQP